jgi:hypothetical protein
MADVILLPKRPTRRRENRQFTSEDYIRGQQILANAIFHWKNDPSDDARAAVRLLMHHVATQFRVDDSPLDPRPVETVQPASSPAPND